jgi:hypothetical protein
VIVPVDGETADLLAARDIHVRTEHRPHPLLSVCDEADLRSTAQLTDRVSGGGGDADDDAAAAANGGQQECFGEELQPDVAAGGAQGAAESDLGTSLEDSDHHGIGNADTPDEERDGTGAARARVTRGVIRGAEVERVRHATSVDRTVLQPGR